MEVAEAVEMINKSMEEAQANLENSSIELQKAVVSLATVTDKNAETGFKILFFKIGGSVNYNNSNTVKFTFSKPPPKPPEEAIYKFSDMKNDLVDIITKSSKIYMSNPDIPNLNKESLEITIAFSIKKKGGAGFEIELFNLSGDYSVNCSHTITLIFGKRKS